MRIAAVFIASLMLVACLDEPETAATAPGEVAPLDSTQFTTIQWIDSVRSFGKINEGQSLQIAFRYKNSGNKPLVIYLVRPSCGCTLAETPQKPLEPGGMGEIKASFNSEGKPGMVAKTIDVIANTKGTQNHKLLFEVEVIPKK